MKEFILVQSPESPEIIHWYGPASKDQRAYTVRPYLEKGMLVRTISLEDMWRHGWIHELSTED